MFTTTDAARCRAVIPRPNRSTLQRGEEWDSQERPEHAGDAGAGGHGQHHGGRVQGHRAALDGRLQEVPLNGLYCQDDKERPQRRGCPALGQGDQYGHQAGQERTHEGDVGAHEDEGAQSGGLGNAEDHQPDEDEQAVDQRDECGMRNSNSGRSHGTAGGFANAVPVRTAPTRW